MQQFLQLQGHQLQDLEAIRPLKTVEYSYRYIIPIKCPHSWSLTFTIPAIFNRTDPSNSIQECCWVWVQQGLVPFRDDVTFYEN